MNQGLLVATRKRRFKNRDDNYPTPKMLYDELDKRFHFDFDPCPANPNGLREFDGLGEWLGKSIYINPPYSKPLPWIKRAIEEQRKGKTIVMLLKSDTSTIWFHDYVVPNARVIFIKGRVNFKGGPSPFPNLIAIFEPKFTFSHDIR